MGGVELGKGTRQWTQSGPTAVLRRKVERRSTGAQVPVGRPRWYLSVERVSVESCTRVGLGAPEDRDLPSRLALLCPCVSSIVDRSRPVSSSCAPVSLLPSTDSRPVSSSCVPVSLPPSTEPPSPSTTKEAPGGETPSGKREIPGELGLGGADGETHFLSGRGSSIQGTVPGGVWT